MIARWFSSLRQDQRGATIVEMALLAPVLTTMTCLMFEIGHVYSAATTLEGATIEAARAASAGNGLCPAQKTLAATNAILSAMRAFPSSKTPTFQVVNYTNFSNVGRNEPFVDANNNNAWNAGESYTDVNGNGRWDLDMGRTGAGDADAVVTYRVTYTTKTMFSRMFAFSFPGGAFDQGNLVLESETTVRNEPFPTVNGC
jgi:Flp pilus assembly protein TadG